MEAPESPRTNANDRGSQPRGPDRHSRAAVILGNDALIAARPSTPAQLSHACHAAGFDIVVPPTWGDELVANAYLARLANCSERVAVACTCPRVRALIDCGAPKEGVCSASIAAPPVAAARYLRATHGASLLITYVGDCPAASDRDINAQFSPHGFLASLERQGISIASQPVSLSDAERARWQRYHSLPGGLPGLRWLARPPVDRVLREAREARIDAAHWASVSKASVLLDFADAASCACGGNRALIEEGEQERSAMPVVVAPVDLDLTPSARLVVPEPHQAPSRAPTPPRGAAVAGAPPPPVKTATAATTRAVTQPATAGPQRGRAMLAFLPVVVLLIAAALGGAVYAVTSSTRASRTAADTSASGGAIAETPPTVDSVAAQDAAPIAASTDTVRDSAAVPSTARLQEPDSARSNTAPARSSTPDSAKADTTSAGQDTVSSVEAARRARKARRVEVVPGWLPQSGATWTPGDTGRLRRPPSPAPPPPAKPDTNPGA